MTKYISALFVVLLFAFSTTAQTSNSNKSVSDTIVATAATEKKKRPPVFRASKDQIMQAQMKMKEKGMYAGEANGNLDAETRAGLKKFQTAENIRATGTLNRITLEKMNIQLSEAQMKIPVAESSTMPGADDEKASTSTRFRATKDQITQAQKMLVDKNLYAGEQSGKMTTDFRAALKKYQTAENLKATGTLTRETIEKMGIALTDKQKAVPQAKAATQPK